MDLTQYPMEACPFSQSDPRQHESQSSQYTIGTYTDRLHPPVQYDEGQQNFFGALPFQGLSHEAVEADWPDSPGSSLSLDRTGHQSKSTLCAIPLAPSFAQSEYEPPLSSILSQCNVLSFQMLTRRVVAPSHDRLLGSSAQPIKYRCPSEYCKKEYLNVGDAMKHMRNIHFPRAAHLCILCTPNPTYISVGKDGCHGHHLIWPTGTFDGVELHSIVGEAVAQAVYSGKGSGNEARTFLRLEALQKHIQQEHPGEAVTGEDWRIRFAPQKHTSACGRCDCVLEDPEDFLTHLKGHYRSNQDRDQPGDTRHMLRNIRRERPLIHEAWCGIRADLVANPHLMPRHGDFVAHRLLHWFGTDFDTGKSLAFNAERSAKAKTARNANTKVDEAWHWLKAQILVQPSYLESNSGMVEQGFRYRLQLDDQAVKDILLDAKDAALLQMGH